MSELSLQQAIQLYRRSLLRLPPSPLMRWKRTYKAVKQDICNIDPFSEEATATTIIGAIAAALAVVLLAKRHLETQRTALLIAIVVVLIITLLSGVLRDSDYFNNLLKKLGFKELVNRLKCYQRVRKIRRKKLFEIIKNILDRRDEVERKIDLEHEAKRTIPLHDLNEIMHLDNHLRQYSIQLARTGHLEAWREICKKQKVWWWSFQKPTHVFDRLDWLWKLLTVCFIIASLSLTVDLATRFWKGGADVWGALAVIGPGIATFLLGKESFEQATRNRDSLDGALRDMRIPQPLRQEVICFLAFLLLLFTGWIYGQQKQIANCYYENAENLLGENQKLTSENVNLQLCQPFLFFSDKPKDEEPNPSAAETDLQRAIALDPNHANAHFQLGFLSELRADIPEAMAHYKLGMQNGSMRSRLRLAGLYLKQQKPESTNTAAEILLDSWRKGEPQKYEDELFAKKEAPQQDQMKMEINQITEDLKSLDTVMAWVRLQQKRYIEADEYSQMAVNKLDDILIERQNTNQGTDGVGKAAYCIRVEVIETLLKNQFLIQGKTVRELETEIIRMRAECNRLSKTDPDEDFWVGKYQERMIKSGSTRP